MDLYFPRSLLNSMGACNPGVPLGDYTEEPKFLRQSLLSDLLAKLDRKDTPHYLIRSQSGMGKTHFIQQIGRYGLQTTETERNWIPLQFPEDHFEIIHTGDVWIRGLEALAGYLRASGKSRDAESMETVIRARTGMGTPTSNAPVSKLNPQIPDNDALLALLLESVRRYASRAVLLIDNLDEMLAGLGTESKIFFDTIQGQPALQLVGTSMSTQQQSVLEQALIPGSFGTIHLEQMDAEESVDFLRRHAEDLHRPDIASGLNGTHRRTKGLIELSGGNPKTMLWLFPLLSKDSHELSIGTLGDILERITPWYRSRMQTLSGPTQRILMQMALHPEPIRRSEILAGAGFDRSLSQAALDELLDQKIAEPLETPDAAEEKLQIVEKFFSVWCLFRARNRERSAWTWLDYFLELFFDPAERENLSRKQLLIPASNKTEMHVGLSLARTIRNPRLASALQFSILKASIDNDPQLEIMKDLLEVHFDDNQLRDTSTRMKSFARVREQINRAKSAQAVIGPVFFDQLFGSSVLSGTEKIELGETANSISPDKWGNLNALLTHESNRWRNLLKHHTVILYKAIGSGLMSALNDIDAAETAFELWKNPVITAISFDAWLGTAIRPPQDRIDRIEAVYRTAIRFDDQLPVLWRNLASLQRGYLGQIHEAESSLRRAIAIDPDQALSWTYLGSLLKSFPDRLRDAEKAYRKALSIQPDDADVYNNLGWFLYRYRGREKEAASLAREALAIDPNHLYSFHTLATVLVRKGRWDDAVSYIRSFIRGFLPDASRSTWKDILGLFHEIVRAKKIEDTIALLDECSSSPYWLALRAALAAKLYDQPRAIEGLAIEIRPLAGNLLNQLNGITTT